MGSQPEINLFDVETQQCPYDAYKQLRDEAPVYRIPGTDMYAVTRYDDVREVLMDPKRFPSSSADTPFRASAGNIERGEMVAARFQDKGWLPAPTLNGRDDPEHKQMRAMFNQAFKPSKIREIDPKVETLAYDLIDDFVEAE